MCLPPSLKRTARAELARSVAALKAAQPAAVADVPDVPVTLLAPIKAETLDGGYASPAHIDAVPAEVQVPCSLDFDLSPVPLSPVSCDLALDSLGSASDLALDSLGSDAWFTDLEFGSLLPDVCKSELLPFETNTELLPFELDMPKALESLDDRAVTPFDLDAYGYDLLMGSSSEATGTGTDGVTSGSESGDGKPVKRSRKRKLAGDLSADELLRTRETNRIAAQRHRGIAKEKESCKKRRYGLLGDRNKTLRDEVQRLQAEAAGLKCLAIHLYRNMPVSTMASLLSGESTLTLRASDAPAVTSLMSV